MYTLNPTASRTSDFLTTFSTANTNIYNGVEFSGNARFGKGFFFAGITTERRETLGCDGSISTTTSPRDNPNGLRFCDNVPPFRTTFKGSASYTMPWDIQVSGSFSGHPRHQRCRQLHGEPGDRRTADRRRHLGHTDDQRQPGRAEHAVPRLSKPARWTRRQDVPLRPLPGAGFVDIFNVLNAGTITTVNQTYGGTWNNPTAILAGRTVRFGTQWEF